MRKQNVHHIAHRLIQNKMLTGGNPTYNSLPHVNDRIPAYLRRI